MVVSVVGLDADDTLWHSESHFAITEDRFRELLEPWLTGDDVSARLLARERANLETFGYGPKGFTLSMIETAIEVTGDDLPASALQKVIDWGKELSSHPVELLDGVAETIDVLAENFTLFLITKGDLFHQESKVAESGIADHFDRIEVLSEKSPTAYERVLAMAEVTPQEFVMVGNSVRSDVLPVIEIGGRAIHIPYDITWGHELIEPGSCEITWPQLTNFADLPTALGTLQ
ncbi:MAG: HAD family hydrolase [Acidimicrobiales bacterium]